MGWWILLTVLAFVTLLMLSSVKLSLDIEEKALFSVSILGIVLFSFDSSDKKDLPKKTGSAHQKSSPAKKDNKLISLLKEYASSKNKGELIGEIFELLKQICVRFKALLKHVRFKKIDLDLTVASSEAAETAILYGKLCSVLYPVITLLDTAIDFDPKRIAVRCDFTADSITLRLQGVIKLRICFILAFAFSLAFSIIKLKIGDLKNVGTQH